MNSKLQKIYKAYKKEIKSQDPYKKTVRKENKNLIKLIKHIKSVSDKKDIEKATVEISNMQIRK